MNLKTSSLTIQNKNTKDQKNAKENPTFSDLNNERNTTSVDTNTIHYRRDLDSLG